VALAEDRDRRADAPDEGNRCYAEKAPRRRDLSHQAEYCYTTQFASCSVFLAWAARNAAEPAYVHEAAQRAWGSGVAMPEAGASRSAQGMGSGWVGGPTTPGGGGEPGGGAGDPASGLLTGTRAYGDETLMPTPEGGLFGPPDPAEAAASRPPSELLDWVSASAWAEAPWDPDAEAEVEELEAREADIEVELTDEEAPGSEEALQGPKVPAALPLRRRRQAPDPIRARGSGEWLYADPLAHQPLVGRRGSVGPPIMLAVLGLLVVSLIVFLLPALLGGSDGSRTAALSSPSPGAAVRVVPTRFPQATPRASASPSPTPEPEIRTYTVKPGDTLSGIAAKAKVNMRLLQCINGLVNANLLQQGQELLIPPDGYACPPGWRRGGQTSATPLPSPAP
jgi:LysM repeat protein